MNAYDWLTLLYYSLLALAGSLAVLLLLDLFTYGRRMGPKGQHEPGESWDSWDWP